MTDLNDPTGLVADGLTVRFGGLVAVDDVSLAAPTGRLTGLIGPNGAGKTSTFNACTGLVRLRTGSVRLDGVDVSGLGVAARARRGLGRTFQRMELYDSLDVLENVRLGREAYLAGSRLLRHLGATRAARAEVAAAADEAMALCDITGLASRRAGSLSTGERRLVELAGVLAGPFRVLLLDEPSSGLDRGETERFGEILRHVVDARDLGVLLVEHDMSLVTAVCEYVYVLDFGKRIFEGTMGAAAASSVVRAAYLGGDVADEPVAGR